MNKYIVRWTASGYCVDFYGMVVAETLDKAKELWDEYVKSHEDVRYSWDKAIKAVKYHYGGYIEWKDYDSTNKEEGCYEMPVVNTYEGSDHLRD